MSVTITIESPSAEDARDEMRRLLGQDSAGAAPVQGDLYEGKTSGSWASGSKTQQQNLPRKPDPRNAESSSEEADPLQALLDGTIKEIKAEIPKMSVDELRDLADYEDDGKGRATLLKAIEDEIASRESADEPADEGGAETSETPEPAKAITGLDDDEPAGDDTGLTGEAPTEEKTSEPEQPSLEDCREIGRKVQRLENGTEMLRELLANMGAANLSAAHAEGKAAEFVAGCEKILAEKGE